MEDDDVLQQMQQRDREQQSETSVMSGEERETVGQNQSDLSLSETEHWGKYCNDTEFGVNDGLISTFLLVAGVVGGGLSSNQVLLTAIAGAVAGGISSAASGYIVAKSKKQPLFDEITIERLHIQNYRRVEINEISKLLEKTGIPNFDTTRELRQHLIHHYECNPEALLKIMTVLNFGLAKGDGEMRSPALVGLASGFSFLLGSMPSVLPFCFENNAEGDDYDAKNNATIKLIVASAISCAGLAFVGSVRSWATSGSYLKSSLQNLLVVCFGGGLAYAVGLLLDALVMRQ